MKKLISSLIVAIFFSATCGYCEDIYYPALENQAGYTAHYGSYFAPYTSDIDPFEPADKCRRTPGSGYYNCRNAACLTAGILIGTAVIVGMVVIVINQSHCAHSSH